MAKIFIVTIFPQQIKTFLSEGVFRIASEKGLLQTEVVDLRDWGEGKHKKVDDRPYGGGPGMLLMVDPIYKCVQELKKKEKSSLVVLFSPSGKILDQKDLQVYSDSYFKKHQSYILLCGHYEGFDARVHKHIADVEISLGKFVISGGELPALVFVDGITRLIPGVLGNELSPRQESFQNGEEIDYPQYTRPSEYKGWKVPEILLSGHHENIKKWRKISL